MSKRKLSKAASPTAAPSRHPIPPWVVPSLLLILAGIVAYRNSFDVPFVFDDLLSVLKNTGVRFGDALRPTQIFSRALLYSTFTLNYMIGGQDVWGYHLVNLFLHIINGLLVFAVARHIFSRLPIPPAHMIWSAALAAAVFLVHPIQTESVTYISSRSELLSSFFYLLAFLLFIKWPEAKIGFALSIPVIFLFLLGLGGKETAISLPATLLLYDLIFISRGRPLGPLTRWRFYGVFVVTGLGAIYTLLTGNLKFLLSSPYHLPPKYYFLTQLGVIVRYIQLLFLPVNLNLDHDVHPPSSILDPVVLASGIFIAAIIAAAWYWRERQPVYSFSALWFFLTLAPTSSIVPILDVMFEHRLYLPMIGICLSFPLLVEHVYKFAAKDRQNTGHSLKYAAAIVVLLVIGTIWRNEVWRDPIRLWEDVISKSPDKVRGYSAAIFIYMNRGQFDKGVDVAKRGLQIVDRLSDPLDASQVRQSFSETLGNLYVKLGKLDEATESFNVSIEESKKLGIAPVGIALAYNNLGVAYLYQWNSLQQRRLQISEGEFREKRDSILAKAQAAFARSIELNPDDQWSLDSYINVAVDWGKADDLKSELLAKSEKASDYRTLYTLGKIRFLQKDYAGAAEYFEKAEKIDGARQVVFFNHGFALDQLGDIDGGIAKYIAAIRIDPLFIEAHHNVALLYMKKNDLAQAIDHFTEVLRRDPNHVSTHMNLAKIFIQQGNAAEARKHVDSILNTSPQDPDALAIIQYMKNKNL